VKTRCLFVIRLALLIGTLALFGVGAGCGSSKGTVSGKVTLANGKPMPGGTIEFIPPQGGGIGGSGQINPQDGSYKVEGMTPAVMKVRVMPYRAPNVPNMPGITFGAKEMKDPRESTQQGAEEVEIQDQYMDPDKTPLTCTVKGGSQDGVDFKVE
jgi:hypothetical protein